MYSNQGDQSRPDLHPLDEGAFDVPQNPLDLSSNPLDPYSSQYSFFANSAQPLSFDPVTRQAMDGVLMPSSNLGRSPDVHYSNFYAFPSNGLRKDTEAPLEGSNHPNSTCPIQQMYDAPEQQAYGSSVPADTMLINASGPGAMSIREDAARNTSLLTEAQHSSSRRTASDGAASVYNARRDKGAVRRRKQGKFRVEKTSYSSRRDRKRAPSLKFHSSSPIPPVRTGEPYPTGVRIAVYHIWLTLNPGVVPSEHTLSCLSYAFSDTVEALRNWFSKHVVMDQQEEDSGYRTMTNSDLSIASNYRYNRRECNRKARGVSPTRLERDEGRPYACTSRCGANFRKKGAWKRHEEINRPPKLWLCQFQSCRNRSEGKHVFFRKDHFRMHLTQEHPNSSSSEQYIAARCVQIASNFSEKCIFRQCEAKFKDWSTRIDHIADHLKDAWDFSQWRDSDDDMAETESSVSSVTESSRSEPSNYDDKSEDLDDNDGSGPADPGQNVPGGPYNDRTGCSRPQRGQRLNRRHDGRGSNGLTGSQIAFTVRNIGDRFLHYDHFAAIRRDPKIFMRLRPGLWQTVVDRTKQDISGPCSIVATELEGEPERDEASMSIDLPTLVNGSEEGTLSDNRSISTVSPFVETYDNCTTKNAESSVNFSAKQVPMFPSNLYIYVRCSPLTAGRSYQESEYREGPWTPFTLPTYRLLEAHRRRDLGPRS